jgi:hypothetical protein
MPGVGHPAGAGGELSPLVGGLNSGESGLSKREALDHLDRRQDKISAAQLDKGRANENQFDDSSLLAGCHNVPIGFVFASWLLPKRQ